MTRILDFLRLSRPLFLLGGILLYALGAGIARFLGFQVAWDLYILGQGWVIAMQLATHYLNEYFDASADVQNKNRTMFSGGSGAVGPGRLARNVPFWAAATCLAIVASLTVLLIQQPTFGIDVALVLVLIFLGAFFYSTPPIRLSSSGYGELTTAILVANLVPALAFLLQTGELHRLVAMTTFPLTFLHLAMMLAFEFPDYAVDLKYEKRTLLVRAGWQIGMRIHNYAILTGFLVLGIALVFGMPQSVGLPALLTLPLGIFQIWYMGKIADGAKPNWTVLLFGALALFGLTAYLITFALWTR
jgi:1,4-dihydroxy-2-naphthoate polyprenyltransferase